MKIHGNLIIRKGEEKKYKGVTEVSGSVYVQEGARFTAPALTEVSGYVDVKEGARFTAPALKSNDTHLIIKGKKYKHTYYDGVTFYVEKSKTSKGIEIITGIYNVKIINNIAIFNNGFIAKKDGFSAHGETVKKAISDLNFKIQSEKLRNEPITMETVMTDNYYRLITGACEMGVKSWKEQNHVLLEEIKVKDLLPLLEKTNAYGLERFKNLIK